MARLRDQGVCDINVRSSVTADGHFRSSSSPRHQKENSLLHKKSEENVIDFENIESMPSHICHYWTGRTTQEFMELYNSVPIQFIISKNSKSALAMLLIKIYNW